MSRLFPVFWLPVTWFFSTAATVGDPVASKSAEALSLFKQGAFEQALQLYRDAQLERPDEPALNFNVGSSLFKQGDLETALQELSRAAEQADGLLGASAHYNMGNVWFQQQQYEQAIASYRQALELNAKDLDSKANLELALQKLDEQQQQQQQDQQDQNQEQNQDQDQQDQNQEQNQDQDQQEQGEEQQDSGEQDPQDTGQPEQEQAPSQPDEGGGEDQERGQQSETEGEPEQSEEHIGQKEAEQLLEALKNREIDAQKRRYRATSASRGKDW